MRGQIQRAAVSTKTNIAEGFNRSQAKFSNTLDIALGEANESENWLYKLRDAGFLSQDRAKVHVRNCIEIEKMLASLRRAIRNRSNPPEGKK